MRDICPKSPITTFVTGAFKRNVLHIAKVTSMTWLFCSLVQVASSFKNSRCMRIYRTYSIARKQTSLTIYLCGYTVRVLQANLKGPYRYLADNLQVLTLEAHRYPSTWDQCIIHNCYHSFWARPPIAIVASWKHTTQWLANLNSSYWKPFVEWTVSECAIINVICQRTDIVSFNFVLCSSLLYWL